ncbi:MAG: enoyl-CoA hydratase-related protein, partial [Actinomycetota bacterium]|nr:enoyl-CoA hydratase-related protein [Actinomycetota bacterium]
MSSASFVRLSLDGHVATVTLSRPAALNAISSEVANELGGALLQAAANREAWVVVLAADGERAFCVGADLKERNRLDDRGWMRNRVLIRSM